MKIKPTYYWDANVFIAHIKDEKSPLRSQGETSGLREIVNEIDEDKANLVSSVIVNTEILPGDLTKEQKERYNSIFKRPNIVLINVHTNVANKASEIRDYYRQRTVSILTPDAIHLATALLIDVDIFHTFDDKLLNLDGNVMGENLKIRKPASQQKILGF
ncbi:MAG: type II toxin-antitoxin system VapC family toxin [Candidatus Brocadiales bacterium]